MIKLSQAWRLDQPDHAYGKVCGCRACHYEAYHFWFGVSATEEPKSDCRFNYLKLYYPFVFTKELKEEEVGDRVFKYNFKDSSIQKLCYEQKEESFKPYCVDGLEDAEEVEDEDLKECIVYEADKIKEN